AKRTQSHSRTWYRRRSYRRCSCPQVPARHPAAIAPCETNPIPFPATAPPPVLPAVFLRPSTARHPAYRAVRNEPNPISEHSSPGPRSLAPGPRPAIRYNPAERLVILMRRTLFAFLVILAPALAQQAAVPVELENSRITGVNKEPAHATFTPYPGEAEALRADVAGSVLTKSLNGLWKFHWVKQPGERPVDRLPAPPPGGLFPPHVRSARRLDPPRDLPRFRWRELRLGPVRQWTEGGIQSGFPAAGGVRYYSVRETGN